MKAQGGDMSKSKKNISVSEVKIAELDEEIYKLRNSAKIIGELDQDHVLIISEQETLPEAVERQVKINSLLARKELKTLYEDAR